VIDTFLVFQPNFLTNAFAVSDNSGGASRFLINKALLVLVPDFTLLPFAFNHLVSLGVILLFELPLRGKCCPLFLCH
jgi:hypothetical protein